MRFENINTDRKLQLVKQILEHYATDMQMILDAHRHEKGFIANLTQDHKTEVNDCLVSMIQQLEEIGNERSDLTPTL